MTFRVVAHGQHLPLLHPRHKLRKRVKALSHLVPAGMLVQGAIMAYLNGDPEWMRALEFLVGAAYIALFVRDWKQAGHLGTVHHAGPEWLELAAASIAALEGFHIWHAHHVADEVHGRHSLHLLPWLYWMIGVVYVVLALNAGRLARRQGLQIDNGGFSLRRLPISPKRRFEWEHISRITPAANGLDLHLHPSAGGQPQLLKLSAYTNAAELSSAIRAKAASLPDAPAALQQEPQSPQ